MPIGLSPKQTVAVSLATDVVDYPDEAQRPAFLCRFMSCEAHVELWEILPRAYGEDDNRKCSELLDQVLALGVVGWRNMPGEFSIPAISKLLTVREKWELIAKMQSQTRLEEAERGKFAAGAASGSAGAAPAAAATATAATA